MASVNGTQPSFARIISYDGNPAEIVMSAATAFIGNIVGWKAIVGLILAIIIYDQGSSLPLGQSLK